MFEMQAIAGMLMKLFPDSEIVEVNCPKKKNCGSQKYLFV